MEKDLSILKKKLSTFKSSTGRLGKLSDDLLLEIVNAWEEWPGTAQSFYISIGSTYKQMGPIMGKAKALKRDGNFTHSEFTPVGAIETPTNVTELNSQKVPIILNWKKGRSIRFYKVEHLIEFLNRYEDEKNEAA